MQQSLGEYPPAGEGNEMRISLDFLWEHTFTINSSINSSNELLLIIVAVGVMMGVGWDGDLEYVNSE